MFSHLASAMAAVVLVVVVNAATANAHEGHDHDAQRTVAPAHVTPRGEAHSGAFELLAVARGATLVVYLDSFSSNEPIVGATIEVETPDGPAKAAESDGVYRIDAPWLTRDGVFELIFTVTAGGDTEILPLTLNVPAKEASASAAHSSWESSLAHYSKMLIEPVALGTAGAGFVLGVAFMMFGRRRRASAAVIAGALVLAMPQFLPPAIAHEGHSHDNGAEPAVTNSERAQRQPDGAIFVPKPIQRIFGIRTAALQTGTFRRSAELPGRIIPDPNASGFVQTATSGRLSPPPGGFPRLGTPVKQGDVLAYVTPPMQAIDVSDMRQRQGELDQQISIVERRLARYQALASSGAVARAQLEDTKLELEGLQDRRAALDRVRRDPDALIAPVSGVIADGSPVAGQIAQTNAVVFHIIDPAKLWIEALSFEAHASPGPASAKTSSGTPLALDFRGSGLADRSQSIPVHFAIRDETSGLRAGQFVTVFVESGEQKQGLAVPRTAVVRGANGQDFVFEHATAERFEVRPVRVEPLDAERMLISAGLEAGRRVVVQGAELLDHVR